MRNVTCDTRIYIHPDLIIFIMLSMLYFICTCYRILRLFSNKSDYYVITWGLSGLDHCVCDWMVAGSNPQIDRRLFLH